MDWKQFEARARNHLSAYFGVPLSEKSPSGFPKKFAVVSEDDKIIGDAKFLTLVHGEKLPRRNYTAYFCVESE